MSQKQFVLLSHDWPSPHFDLMLEAAGELWTWRLAALPGAAWGDALRLANHRLRYLDYEGPLDGNRGSVTRRDRGTYKGELAGESIVLHVEGATLQGVLEMRRAEADGWQVRLTPAGAIPQSR